MVNRNWSEIVRNTLLDEVGPLADILLADVMEAAGIDEGEETPGKLVRFLKQLYADMPADFDRADICSRLSREILNVDIFENP